jgi:hypothetical protein
LRTDEAARRSCELNLALGLANNLAEDFAQDVDTRGLGINKGGGPSGQRSVETEGLWVNGVVRLNVLSDQSHKLRHHGFHPRGISGQIGGPKQDPVKPFVVGTDLEALPGRPLGPSRIPDGNAVFRVPTGKIDDDSFDVRGYSFQQNPIWSPQPFERTSTNQLDRRVPTLWFFALGELHEPVPVTPDARAECETSMGAGQMVLP